MKLPLFICRVDEEAEDMVRQHGRHESRDKERAERDSRQHHDGRGNRNHERSRSRERKDRDREERSRHHDGSNRYCWRRGAILRRIIALDAASLLTVHALASLSLSGTGPMQKETGMKIRSHVASAGAAGLDED